MKKQNLLLVTLAGGNAFVIRRSVRYPQNLQQSPQNSLFIWRVVGYISTQREKTHAPKAGSWRMRSNMEIYVYESVVYGMLDFLSYKQQHSINCKCRF
jgi:hypothetical protein